MRKIFEDICHRAESKVRRGPTQAATENQNSNTQYNNSKRKQLATMRLKAPDYMHWYQLFYCTAIGNDDEDAVPVDITHHGASILDLPSALHVEAQR